MRRAYRPGRLRKFLHEWGWDLLAWIVALALVALVLRPVWNRTAPPAWRSSDVREGEAVESDPDERARGPPRGVVSCQLSVVSCQSENRR
jgi:hypothetical protein